MSEAVYAQVQKNKTNTDNDLPRSVLNSQGPNDVNQPQAASYNQPRYTSQTARVPIRFPNASDGNVRMPFPQDLTSNSNQPEVHIIEQQTKPYWESGEGSFDDWSQHQCEGYHDETYDPEQTSPDDYHNYQLQYKKKGLSAKIDRLVQRFPALGVFYKQPPSPVDKSRPEVEHQYDDTLPSAHTDEPEPELAVDELTLNKRYSDKLHTQIITLPYNDQTQPVDVCIHHEKNQIYSCDIGRSIIEIFDMNGKIQHVINDSTMIQFQPTAIAVASDGTVIAASHFHHRLHMYSPSGSQNETYRYKQYKLGAPGNEIHQFNYPAGIAIDHTDGYLYICDRGNYRIQVMSPEGICERVIELFIKDKKQKYPLDPVRISHQQNSDQMVCIVGEGDAICFISKHANGRTYVNPISIVDENGLNLEGASGLATDSQDRIFISDTGHHRIVICTPQGDYITSFGSGGAEPGELKRPCGLDITDDGTVVVTDAGNKRIQLFGTIHQQVVVDTNPLPPPPPPENTNGGDNTELDEACFL